MGLNRRKFLQGTGLGAIALSINPYLQALATPTPRKLALLVGIDHYGDPSLDLKGCLTDIELQKELLIYRFGFNPADIILLGNEKAHREGIETAFLEHLIKQAQTGDVVVFHYSGYGHQVGTENGLLASDGLQMPQKIPAQQDILKTTLELLGRSLSTDKYTLILDTSYESQEKTTLGNLRSRSFPVPSPQVNLAELELQSKLAPAKSKKNLGTVLQAAHPGQVATEIRGLGWNAGLFTYSLTQYLWQMSAPSRVITSLAHSAETVTQIRGTLQEPEALRTNQGKQLLYYLLPLTSQGGEGVVTNIEGNTVTLLLKGLPPLLLDYLGVNSLFTGSQSQTPLPIQSRQGGKAKATNISKESSPSLGELVQEVIRVLPKTLKLLVNPDSSLSRIERVDATSAISSIEQVDVDGALESRADILLSRIPVDSQGMGYGLSTLGGARFLQTVGPVNEAIKSALVRLTPKFRSLLAAKYWHLTLNESSSRLEVAVSLEKVSQAVETVVRKQTRAVNIPAELSSPEGLNQLSQGSNLQYRLENLSAEPIYAVVVGLDGTARAVSAKVLMPLKIEPHSNQVVPEPRSEAGVLGLQQIYVICCRQPLDETAKALAQETVATVGVLSHPLGVAQAILQDLEQASQNARGKLSNLSDSYALAVEQWATFSFVYHLG
jgi:hypothetical protein